MNFNAKLLQHLNIETPFLYKAFQIIQINEHFVKVFYLHKFIIDLLFILYKINRRQNVQKTVNETRIVVHISNIHTYIPGKE